MKKVLGFCFIFISQSLSAQYLQLLDYTQNWIFKNADIKDKKLVFVRFTKDKVDLNTMIWKFLPNGRLEYDYQSDDEVFACAGVNFLDLDLPECSWAYNPSTLIMTLQIKGGYSSMDDFVFKRDYKVGMLEQNNSDAYTLDLEREQYFNDLNR